MNRGRGRRNQRRPHSGGSRRPLYRGSPGQSSNSRGDSCSQDQRTRSMDDPGRRLSEPSLSITEYISNLPGFSGIIKARYSDFHVNEIDQSGYVTKLTDDKAPVIPEEEVCDSNHVDDEENPDKFDTTVLPLDTWKKISDLVTQSDSTEIKVDATNMSKEERTRIHNLVKRQFGTAVIGSTLSENEKKYITFKKFSKNAQLDNRVKWLWPGPWVYFLMHKENMDTMQAAVELGNVLKMKPGKITYAGTKDRRAKTTQWFCVPKIQPERLVKACRNARNIWIGNFTFKDTALRLGQLKGNRFRIALRNVVGEDELINKALESLKNNGFINYYGLQRFGSCVEVPTHRIGLALLQGNWKQAVELILKPRDDENNFQMRTARELWWETRNAQSALDILGRYSATVEAKLLFGLSRCKPNDYVTALENIPRNMRLLYLHSYQSLLWNSIVSRRIREGGLTPLKGDLVFTDVEETNELVEDLANLIDDDDADKRNEVCEAGSEAPMEANSTATERNEKVCEGSEAPTEVNSTATESNEAVCEASIEAPTEVNNTATESNEAGCEASSEAPMEVNNTATEKGQEISSTTDESNSMRGSNVKILTQEDVDSGTYTIFDIVCPLPGYDVVYPDNEMSDWYKELLANDGLTSETMKNRVKTYSLSGAYRKILSKPENMSWSMVFYDDPQETLILSDVEELQGQKLPEGKTEGKYKALIIDFCLKSSTYATMALREILKGDTSSESQAKLNSYHENSANDDNPINEDQSKSTVKRHISDGIDAVDAKKLKEE